MEKKKIGVDFVFVLEILSCVQKEDNFLINIRYEMNTEADHLDSNVITR